MKPATGRAHRPRGRCNSPPRPGAARQRRGGRTVSEAEAHEDCSLCVRPRHRGTGPRPASVCGELGRSWSASPKSHLFPAAFRWQFAASLGDDTQETGRRKAQGRRRQAATTARETRGRARLCQHRSPGEGDRDPGSCAGNGDLAFLRGSAATRWLTSPGRGHSGNSTRSGYSRGRGVNARQPHKR